MPALELEHAIGFNGTANSPLHVHPNGTDVAYASGGCVVLADLRDPHKQSFLRGHDDTVSCLAMSRSGRLVVSGQMGDNADVIVWEFESQRELYRLQEHDHGVAFVGLTEDERFLLTVGVAADHKMVVWDLHTGCLVASTSKMRPTTCACWGERKKDIKRRDTTCYQIVTGGPGNHLDCWTLDPQEGTLAKEACNTGNQARDFTTVCFGWDREYVYAGSTSGDFTAVHVKHNLMHSVTAACTNGVTALCARRAEGSDNDELLVGGGDGAIVQFEGRGRHYLKTGQVTLEGGVTALQPGEGGRLLAGTSYGFLYAVELAEGGAA